MSHYSSHPSELMDYGDAVMYLWRKYRIEFIYGEDLLARARVSESGMASVTRGGQTVWATRMKTQGGKFVIEIE